MKAFSNISSFFKRWAKINISKYFEGQIIYFERLKLLKILKKNNQITLIYTIGKVGSSSVYKSLTTNKNFTIPVFHIHSLNPARIEKQKNYYKKSNRKSLPLHLIRSEILGTLLQSYKGKIFIVTLVREPIERELSSLYQDSFNFTSASNLTGFRMNNVVLDKMKSLIQNLPEEEWFESELKSVFGFDVFSEDFNVVPGYKVIAKEEKKLAFIRLENLNQEFNKIFTELFEENYEFRLSITNDSGNKFYNRAYKNIKKQTQYKEEDLNKLLSSRFVQKFYPDQILQIKARWQKES